MDDWNLYILFAVGGSLFVMFSSCYLYHKRKDMKRRKLEKAYEKQREEVFAEVVKRSIKLQSTTTDDTIDGLDANAKLAMPPLPPEIPCSRRPVQAHGPKWSSPGELSNPQLPGQYGNPQVLGYPGNPQLPGYLGNPQVPGYPGNPQVPGYPGNPQVAGYPGNPQVPGYPGNPQVAGYPGNPQVPGYPGNPQVGGYPGNPQVPGYPGNPQVIGKYGNPQVNGKYGNPQVDGKYRNPQVNGKYGNPHVGGKYGNPQVGGKYGNPQVGGNNGNPQVNGKYENPQVNGKYENPQVNGKYGNPQVDGKYGNPQLPGHPGNPQLPSYPGNPQLPGYPGNPLLPAKYGDLSPADLPRSKWSPGHYPVHHSLSPEPNYRERPQTQGYRCQVHQTCCRHACCCRGSQCRRMPPPRPPPPHFHTQYSRGSGASNFSGTSGSVHIHCERIPPENYPSLDPISLPVTKSNGQRAYVANQFFKNNANSSNSQESSVSRTPSPSPSINQYGTTPGFLPNHVPFTSQIQTSTNRKLSPHSQASNRSPSPATMQASHSPAMTRKLSPHQKFLSRSPSPQRQISNRGVSPQNGYMRNSKTKLSPSRGNSRRRHHEDNDNDPHMAKIEYQINSHGHKGGNGIIEIGISTLGVGPSNPNNSVKTQSGGTQYSAPTDRGTGSHHKLELHSRSRSRKRNYGPRNMRDEGYLTQGSKFGGQTSQYYRSDQASHGPSQHETSHGPSQRSTTYERSQHSAQYGPSSSAQPYETIQQSSHDGRSQYTNASETRQYMNAHQSGPANSLRSPSPHYSKYGQAGEPSPYNSRQGTPAGINSAYDQAGTPLKENDLGKPTSSGKGIIGQNNATAPVGQSDSARYSPPPAGTYRPNNYNSNPTNGYQSATDFNVTGSRMESGSVMAGDLLMPSGYQVQGNQFAGGEHPNPPGCICKHPCPPPCPIPFQSNGPMLPRPLPRQINNNYGVLSLKNGKTRSNKRKRRTRSGQTGRPPPSPSKDPYVPAPASSVSVTQKYGCPVQDPCYTKSQMEQIDCEGKMEECFCCCRPIYCTDCFCCSSPPKRLRW